MSDPAKHPDPFLVAIGEFQLAFNRFTAVAHEASPSLTPFLERIRDLEAELREERSLLSYIAEAIGLAHYGGAYNPEHVLPRVKALVADSTRAVVPLSGIGTGDFYPPTTPSDDA